MEQRKAFELLARQPLSVHDFQPDKYHDIVLSAVVDSREAMHIVSRYTDPVWDLWPFFEQSNVANSRKRINWTNIPAQFRDVCKAVAYRLWLVGSPGEKAPCAATLIKHVGNFGVFTRYLEKISVRSLADVTQLHIANFIHEEKNGKRVSIDTLAHRLVSIERLHLLADQHPEGLVCRPWQGSSAFEMAGRSGAIANNASRTGKTPLIPKPIARTLFCFAETILESADSILDECDAGRRSRYQDRDVLLIRDACFFMLGVLTGMRCDELVGIEVGAGRTEVKDGITYHWIRSIEHKTLKGRVEYMMPSIGHEILRIMERWSKPLRRRLPKRIKSWESSTRNGVLERQQLIANARADRNRLFLGTGHGGVHAVSGPGWGMKMKRFAKDAGVNWDLAPHQLRRLYAWTFVRHRLGNLVFLKEQFKHSSIDMSQLYAANPLQDVGIYDEILMELRSQKVDIIHSWLFDDQPLAGGAGKKMMALRAHDFPNRKAMIEETSDKLNLRSTGHGWCLAQDEGCGGAGLYEQARCAGCGNGLIDGSFKPVWQEIYRHHTELLDEVKDLGPGASQRVYRDLEKAKTVLTDLGVDVVQGERFD